MSPKEWADAAKYGVDYLRVEAGPLVWNAWNDENPQIFALANYALPADSPYKVTRADVEFLREIGSALYAGIWQEPARRLADKLASLLPP